MVKPANRILLARIGAPHGVKGAVRVKTFTGDPLAIGQYGRLFSKDGRPFEITGLRPDKAGVIASFRAVDDRNAAEALNGTELYIDRSALPPPDDADEFYHADLLGLSVENKDGAVLGSVAAVQDYGAGELLEIASAKGRSLLIPFTKAAVPVIDIAGGRIVVDPPPETEARPNEPEGKNTP